MANAAEGRVMIAWTPESWLEMLCSTCLLPFCQRFLDLPWCTRVECTDTDGLTLCHVRVATTTSRWKRQKQCSGQLASDCYAHQKSTREFYKGGTMLHVWELSARVGRPVDVSTRFV
eukprot:5477982-Amphidinium_carterae.1